MVWPEEARPTPMDTEEEAPGGGDERRRRGDRPYRSAAEADAAARALLVEAAAAEAEAARLAAVERGEVEEPEADEEDEAEKGEDNGVREAEEAGDGDWSVELEAEVADDEWDAEEWDEDEKADVEKNLQAGDFGFDTPVL